MRIPFLTPKTRDYALEPLTVKDSPAVARRYNVSRTPAVVALRGGQQVSRGDGIGEREVEAHTLYLLGKGPQPAGAAPGGASGGAGAGHPVVVTDRGSTRTCTGCVRSLPRAVSLTVYVPGSTNVPFGGPNHPSSLASAL